LLLLLLLLLLKRRGFRERRRKRRRGGWGLLGEGSVLEGGRTLSGQLLRRHGRSERRPCILTRLRSVLFASLLLVLQQLWLLCCFISPRARARRSFT